MGRKRKYGWAKTKFKGFIEHQSSYVRYNPSDNDEIYFISFTHKSKEVSLFGKTYIPKELTYNINPNEKDKKSHYVPVIFVGKRSHLGTEENKYRLHNADRNNLVGLSSVFERIFVPNEMKRKKNNEKKQKSKSKNNKSFSK